MPKERILLLYLYTVGLLFLVLCNLFVGFGEQQFTLLAHSLLQGSFALGPATISRDASYYHGLAYWPQGIFPAIVLLPFIFLLHNVVQQGHIQFVLNLLNGYLLYAIAQKITKDRNTSLWLSFAYLFATGYLVVGLFPWSWWFGQIVATTCVLLMLYEYFHVRRWWLLGIFIACAMATRIDLLLTVLFPLILIVVSKQKPKEKIVAVCLLMAPIFFGLAGIGLYNFVRFGSVIEFGYTYHIPIITTSGNMLKEHGTWSLFYVPTNLYYLFLSGLQGVYVPGTKYLTYPYVKPDAWGMSIFLTSPILLWCFKTKQKEIVVKAAATTALFILLFIIGYFGVGSRQYGFRYALDFQPFLFVILCFSFQRVMSWRVKTLIAVSFLINFFLFPSIFTAVVK